MALFDFHLQKLEHALIFQVIDQEIYTPVFDAFKSSNGWDVYSDTGCYPHINYIRKDIFLRSSAEGEGLEDKYHTDVIMFDTNDERDKTYNEIMLALEEWALKARKFSEI